MELLFVHNLDVKSSSILDRVGIFVLTVIVLARLRLSLLILVRKLLNSKFNGVFGSLRSEHVLGIKLVLLSWETWGSLNARSRRLIVSVWSLF